MKLKHQYYFNTLKKMALSIPLSMTNNQHVKFFHVVSTTTHLHTYTNSHTYLRKILVFQSVKLVSFSFLYNCLQSNAIFLVSTYDGSSVETNGFWWMWHALVTYYLSPHVLSVFSYLLRVKHQVNWKRLNELKFTYGTVH